MKQTIINFINQDEFCHVIYHQEVINKKESKKELKINTEKARITLLEAISSDLNTPLKVIVNAVSTLKKVEEKGIRTIGKDIDFEIAKLSQLNNNILRIIQLEFQDLKFKKTPQSLSEMIDVVIKLSAKSLKARTVQIHIPKNIPSVPLNSGLIHEVITNLVDNAVKFTPSESPISISVHLEEDSVVVSVEDTGPGVEHEEKNKLFETFYRGKQLMSVHGLGLGLAICQKIIEAHGGKIWVENNKSQGAAFRFSLPLQREGLSHHS